MKIHDNPVGIIKKDIYIIKNDINNKVYNGQLTSTKKDSSKLTINDKLTEEQIDEIINTLRYTYRFNGEIARKYGVKARVISKINSGEAYYRKDIKYPIRNWKSGGAVLFTYEQVTEILKELQTTDHSLNSIAKKYNVSFNDIKDINVGKTKKYRRRGLTYPIRKPY